MAIQIFPTQLKLKQTIVPGQPLSADKIMVYKDNIYLLSSSNKAVIAIDRSGKIVGKLGAKGEGPGEFKYISDFTISRDQFIIGGSKRIQNSNRPVFVSGTGTKAAVFMTRRREFYLLHDNQLHRQKITATLESEDITNRDKQAFNKENPACPYFFYPVNTHRFF
jgi:hypothetical protein